MSNVNVQIIKERRRTITIRISEDLNVIVKAPKNISNEYINAYIKSHNEWINNAIENQRQRNNKVFKLSEDEILACKNKANQIFPVLIEHYSRIMGVTYRKIHIKELKSKWGSCNKDGDITLNYRLMITNDDVIKYVVIHELAHRKYMNHSKNFYSFIEKFMPSYKESVKYLKDNGYIIMKAFEREKK